jgi:aspartate 4-decarboxylase
LQNIIEIYRQHLILLTEDVYSTFMDDFVSMFAVCPQNTILL